MGWRVSEWSGRHSTLALNGGLSICAAEGESLDVKMIIVGVLVAILITCVIAYGIWLRKGDKEENKPTVK
jgi:hypothetical protein